eukprot:COSAG05_NODE_20882_length_276_cov_0.581921_1_plen_92_part_11
MTLQGYTQARPKHALELDNAAKLDGVEAGALLPRHAEGLLQLVAALGLHVLVRLTEICHLLTQLRYVPVLHKHSTRTRIHTHTHTSQNASFI